MAFNVTSYFAGVGTVAAALAIGFGGALIVTDTHHKPSAPNRLERVASTVSTMADAAQPVSAAAAAPSGAQADTPARRVEDNPSPVSAEKEQAPQAQMASVEPAATPAEAASRPEANGGEQAARNSNVEDRPRETRKASERAERLERRKREQARLERRKQRDRDAPVMAQRQLPVVVRDDVESREEPSPRLSLFGED